MAADETAVINCIDTHTDAHQAALIDTVGRHLATEASRPRRTAGSWGDPHAAGDTQLGPAADHGGRHPRPSALGGVLRAAVRGRSDSGAGQEEHCTNPAEGAAPVSEGRFPPG